MQKSIAKSLLAVALSALLLSGCGAASPSATHSKPSIPDQGQRIDTRNALATLRRTMIGDRKANRLKFGSLDSAVMRYVEAGKVFLVQSNDQFHGVYPGCGSDPGYSMFIQSTTYLTDLFKEKLPDGGWKFEPALSSPEIIKQLSKQYFATFSKDGLLAQMYVDAEKCNISGKNNQPVYDYIFTVSKSAAKDVAALKSIVRDLPELDGGAVSRRIGDWVEFDAQPTETEVHPLSLLRLKSNKWIIVNDDVSKVDCSVVTDAPWQMVDCPRR